MEPQSAYMNMTTNWVSRHLPGLPPDLDRVILPGFCRGDVEEVSRAAGAPAERGPTDLRDLPEFFGKRSGPSDYGRFDIEKRKAGPYWFIVTLYGDH